MLYNTGLASLYAMLFYAICRGLAISRFSLQAAREAHKEQLEEAAHYRIRVCGLLDLDVPSYPPTERLKLSYVGVKSSGRLLLSRRVTIQGPATEHIPVSQYQDGYYRGRARV